MRFTSITLRTTSDKFHDALVARNLSLPLTKRLNVWSQIVAGKNYSAAHSLADAHGAIAAVPLSVERIQVVLRKRSRSVDHRAASEIFAEAVSDDLLEVSEYMYQLVRIIRRHRGNCLLEVSSDPLGLGVVNAEQAGYHGVSKLCPFTGSEHERGWLCASAGLVADAVNRLAGYTNEESTEIVFANLRKGDVRQDETFAEFVRERAESLSHAFAARMIEEMHDTPVTEWSDADFDEVRDIAFDFLDDEVRKARREAGTNWLSAECSLSEAVIDHLAAQSREALRHFAFDARDGRSLDWSYADSLAHTARLAIARIVR